MPAATITVGPFRSHSQMDSSGFSAGLVLGKTDARGDTPTDRPATPADPAAMLYLELGIDAQQELEALDGRPIRIVDHA